MFGQALSQINAHVEQKKLNILMSQGDTGDVGNDSSKRCGADPGRQQLQTGPLHNAGRCRLCPIVTNQYDWQVTGTDIKRAKTPVEPTDAQAAHHAAQYTATSTRKRAYRQKTLAARTGGTTRA